MNLLDIYSGNLGQSAQVDKMVERLHRRVRDEVEPYTPSVRIPDTPNSKLRFKAVRSGCLQHVQHSLCLPRLLGHPPARPAVGSQEHPRTPPGRTQRRGRHEPSRYLLWIQGRQIRLPSTCPAFPLFATLVGPSPLRRARGGADAIWRAIFCTGFA
jgi:hypothetical protein